MLLQRKRKQLETHIIYILLYGRQKLVSRAEVFHEDPFVAVSAQHVVKNKHIEAIYSLQSSQDQKG